MATNVVAPLRQLWADNFVVYFKSHGFHFNVQGPTFAQDHSLLQEVYEFLWGAHDDLGEQIRQQSTLVPMKVSQVLSLSSVDESGDKGTGGGFKELVSDLEELQTCAQALFDMSSCCAGLNTYIGDYSRDLSKLVWKVKARLGDSTK